MSLELQSLLSDKLCILGIHPTHFKLAANQVKVLDFGLLQARRAVALSWKSLEPPTLRMWHRELMNCIGLERLTHIMTELFLFQLWEIYMDALETRTL